LSRSGEGRMVGKGRRESMSKSSLKWVLQCYIPSNFEF
jgi:hypothetical protein